MPYSTSLINANDPCMYKFNKGILKNEGSSPPPESLIIYTSYANIKT